MLKELRLCDLTGVEGASTVPFSVGGQYWEIDLSEEALAHLGDVLAPYVAVARSMEPPVRRTRRPRRSKEEIAAGAIAETVPTFASLVRAWATENGVELPAKGRVPKEINAAYREATKAAQDASNSGDHVDAEQDAVK